MYSLINRCILIFRNRNLLTLSCLFIICTFFSIQLIRYVRKQAIEILYDCKCHKYFYSIRMSWYIKVCTYMKLETHVHAAIKLREHCQVPWFTSMLAAKIKVSRFFFAGRNRHLRRDSCIWQFLPIYYS